MSGSEPVWADQSRGAWWLSPAATSTQDRRHPAAGTIGVFRSRLAVVQAMYNDGRLGRATAIVEWVSAIGGARAYVERLALGNWGVVVLRPERSDALWVLTDQHLVLDPRRRPQLDTFTDDEFRACYETTIGRRQPVRECPIFDDGEVAS